MRVRKTAFALRATLDLLLIANQPINGTGMQTASDGDVGRGRMDRCIAEEVDSSACEIALLAQALFGGASHICSPSLLLGFASLMFLV